ncbi:hypothetical protein IWZ01DRAFT_101716 [Phyllosticta capitalensis]
MWSKDEVMCRLIEHNARTYIRYKRTQAIGIGRPFRSFFHTSPFTRKCETSKGFAIPLTAGYQGRMVVESGPVWIEEQQASGKPNRHHLCRRFNPVERDLQSAYTSLKAATFQLQKPDTTISRLHSTNHNRYHLLVKNAGTRPARPINTSLKVMTTTQPVSPRPRTPILPAPSLLNHSPPPRSQRPRRQDGLNSTSPLRLALGAPRCAVFSDRRVI